MTIYIYCPYGVQNPESGGVMALKRLNLDLQALGANSVLAIHDGFQGPDVAVYAEGIVGNPLNAKLCVKWLLYHQPEAMNYGHHEVIFSWPEGFKAKNPVQVEAELFTMSFDSSKWVDKQEKREGICYVVRKGRNKQTTEIMDRLKGAVCIDNYSSVDFLIDVFNKYEQFISLDDHTLLSLIAAKCGCVSIVVPTNGVSGEEWRKNDAFLYKYGVAYGFDDIEYALCTANKIPAHLEYLDRLRIEKQKFFLHYCGLRLKNG